MKRGLLFFMEIVFVLLIFNLLNQFATAQIVDTKDKTLSPYFMVKSDDPSIDQLPLYLTSADVYIAGVIADVTVKQVYKNNGKKPIEAIYVFPASTRAAVYSMVMKIGGRKLVAEIQKREEARKTYEKAISEGKSASLLEQDRPNVFKMNVGNIMPGDTIEVELKYTELLIPEDGNYEFVYPTVVGPRYSNKTESDAGETDEFINTPYQHEGEMPAYIFDLKVSLDAGLPIDNIDCKTHKVNINYSNSKNSSANIDLDKSDEFGGNRDFIMKYRLAGGKIQTGLLLSKNNNENFFLLMIQPPKRVESKDIPPREYIFILDVSGSMNGKPLEISKNMIKNLLQTLSDNEKFNILFFAGSSMFLACESKPATKENISLAEKLIDNQIGGGGTELLPALKRVYAVPKLQGYSRTIVVITDGYVSVEEEAFRLIHENLNQANVFSFGIGSGVNRFIIEGMARAGLGEPFIITKFDDAAEQAEKFKKYIQYPVLTDIKMDFEGFSAYDYQPKNIPDVLADRPIIIFGKWKGTPGGQIHISGMTGKNRLETYIPVNVFATNNDSPALKYLWARNEISVLSDYNSTNETKERIDSITNLGLNYSLLTKYTSFVAVDYIIRNTDSGMVTVKQPLPLPEDVTDKAIGGDVYGSYPTSQSANALMMGSGGMSMPKRSAGAPLVKSLSNVQAETLPEMNEFILVEKEADFDKDEIKKNIIYPDAAKKASIEGRVIVTVLVTKNGIPLEAKILRSDSQILEKAALDAVMKSHFTPSINGGQPVDSWITIPIDFRLKDASISISKVDNEKIQPDQMPSLDLKALQKSIKYPEKARKEGIEGKVIVKVKVNEKGKVAETKVLFTDSELLNKSALDAIKKAKFSPATKNGKPVEAWVTVPVQFKLQEFDIKVNKIGKDYYRTSSGMDFRIDSHGDGKQIEKGDLVTLQIKGYVDNCFKYIDTYETGKPIQFKYREDNVMQGLADGITGMMKGGKRVLYIPLGLSEGKFTPQDIKPNSQIVLEVELVDIKR